MGTLTDSESRWHDGQFDIATAGENTHVECRPEATNEPESLSCKAPLIC